MALTNDQQIYLDAIYREMATSLARYALANLKNESAAEEVVQDTFRIACTKIEELMRSENPNGWLFLVLKHVIGDKQRAEKRNIRLLCTLFSMQGTEIHSPEQELDLRVLYEDLVQSEDFQILEQYYLLQKNMREIASEKGITLEACKKRIQRARMRLKQYMRDLHRNE